MDKANMKTQLSELEEELSRLTETSVKLRLYIGSAEFKELSDLEATLAVTQHHALEAYARVLTMRAALLGGRLQDPDGERPSTNDETPNPIIQPSAPEILANPGVKIGNTIVTEG